MNETVEQTASSARYVRAARVVDVDAAGCAVVHVEGHTLALLRHGGRIHAIDNRCPHMGFPLHRGSVSDGILTCHWHHARFDLAGGGTFDPWADDLRTFAVEVRDGEVWVDLAPRGDVLAHQRRRLREGLEGNLSLVIGKAVIALAEGGGDPAEAFRIGLDFGTRYRQAGWGQGLTIHTCMLGLRPHLDADDRPRALFHGLAAVARDCDAAPPRFPLRPLPGAEADLPTLQRWVRRFVEVRDAEGAERCIVSAVRAGADHRQMADMLLTAATDHRYLDIGHVVDFANKALEALDVAGWDDAETTLACLAPAYANAARMEESNAWRFPVDLVAVLDRAFAALPAALEAGRARLRRWAGRDALVPVLLGEDAAAIADAALAALREGCAPEDLAATVAYAAVLRIARFATSNEFTDWDTALHSFTFANAVHQSLRRIGPRGDAEGQALLLRGVLDAAMTVYLNRFLNVPPARLPEPDERAAEPAALLTELPALLDKRQQVDEAGGLVARYLHAGGPPERLLAMLGTLLLREDRDFHTIQTVEAAVRLFGLLRGTPAAVHVLVAAARYLAAHAPTMRAQGQTYPIARRLARGERLFEEA
ncbi:MAG: Rieske 2Fe-2S domain-containing protein [Chloroflexi bacterium]|nr:Rieske 2Fe-2S domain-containing protein [Chloroflexota bacterium]